MKRILAALAITCFAFSASAEKILEKTENIEQLQKMMQNVAQDFQKANVAGVQAGCDKVKEFVKKFDEEDVTIVPVHTCNAYVGIVTKNQKQTCSSLKSLETIHARAADTARVELASIDQKLKTEGAPKDDTQKRVMEARKTLQQQFISSNEAARARVQNAMSQHKC